MEQTLRNARLVRFGVFEVDLRSGELRKAGAKLKLSGQPFPGAGYSAGNPGEIVTREDLLQRLWPDTFVDGDHNLNTAINKIREVLGDSAENPALSKQCRGADIVSSPPWRARGSHAASAVPNTSSPSRSPGSLESSAYWSSGLVPLSDRDCGHIPLRLHRVSQPVVQQRSLTRLTSDDGLQTEPPGRRTDASSPTVRPRQENTTSGSSRSAAATPSRSRKVPDRTGCLTGLPTANTSPIAPRRRRRNIHHARSGRNRIAT